MTGRTLMRAPDIFTPSPNCDDRLPPDGHTSPVIDTIVLHYTGMKTADAALKRMCDPDAAVSAHFMIDEMGRVFQLVPPEKRAWHAGVSFWQGREGLNHTSIGIEMVNPGHDFGYSDFPEAQIERLLGLLEDLSGQFQIPANRYLGHSDIAPDRKQDPGEKFPWKRLARMGFGVWPSDETVTGITNNKTILAKKGMIGPEIASLNKLLVLAGYSVSVNEEFSQMTVDALTAFQRHWRQEDVTGHMDEDTLLILKDVAKQLN